MVPQPSATGEHKTKPTQVYIFPFVVNKKGLTPLHVRTYNKSNYQTKVP